MVQICLVGGSGFIGTRLTRHLIQNVGEDVRIIDKSPSKTYPNFVALSDVRSVEQLSQSIPDNSVIINLAAEHRDDVSPKSLYNEVNVEGARNICLVAREKRIKKIIFTSSVAVYGFAKPGTGEDGAISPFNDYGRTKFEAEEIYKAWQAEDPRERSLTIIRPTVVFGEQNRGNVYNLLKQIASGRFIMVGDGKNRKSVAYVENVAAFIEHSLSFGPGVHLYNYVDKPDFSMNEFVSKVNHILGREDKIRFRLPFAIGYAVGKTFDFFAWITGKKFAISSIRVKKFCSNSVYSSAITNTGFIPPVSIEEALERTVRYEFLESNKGREVFYSE